MPLRLNPSLHNEHLNGNVCQLTAASLSTSGLMVAAALGTVDLVAVILAATCKLLSGGFSASFADFST